MKKTLKIAALALSVAVMFAACGGKGSIPSSLKKQGFKEADNGVLVKFTTENANGKAAEPGQIFFGKITMRYNDSVINATEKSVPLGMAQPQSGQRFNIGDNLSLLHEGDVVTFAVSADSIAVLSGGPQSMPPFFKAGNGDFFFYDVVIEKVLTSEEFGLMRQAENEQARTADSVAFAQYIADNNITVKPTKNGVYVVTKEAGNGAKAKDGSKIKVHYTGKLLNGTVFDSSEGRDPIELTLGKHEVISGWEEGLTGLAQGTKATLVIPHSQAYGERANGPIPACSSLVFDVELVEVN